MPEKKGLLSRIFSAPTEKASSKEASSKEASPKTNSETSSEEARGKVVNCEGGCEGRPKTSAKASCEGGCEGGANGREVDACGAEAVSREAWGEPRCAEDGAEPSCKSAAGEARCPASAEGGNAGVRRIHRWTEPSCKSAGEAFFKVEYVHRGAPCCGALRPATTA